MATAKKAAPARAAKTTKKAPATAEPVSRRPAAIVERDQAVLGHLSKGTQLTLDAISTELGIDKNQAYGSIWRLRRDGLVEKVRDGSRTPLWQRTAAAG